MLITGSQYTNAALVTIVCSCGCGLVSGFGKTAHKSSDDPTSTTAHNSHQSCIRVVTSDDEHVETVILNKVIVNVKFVSGWLCLLRNYNAVQFT
jgi:hypothetical protein